ncbi:MAG TPA: hypothetical protein VD793_04085 [Gemmatimonadales bacterium]|nr:hypothetical protein [Gemmatimonadales bacterium]
MRGWISLCAPVMLAACRLELTEPIGSEQPHLSVYVSLTDSAPAALGRLSAVLWTGRDGAGAVRTVPDPALVVAGRALTPTTVTGWGELRYQSDWSFAADGFRGLVVDVIAPALEGVSQAVPPVVLAPWRAGPSTVTARRGEDVRLNLTAPGDSLSGVSAIWSLRVQPAPWSDRQAPLFHASGSGPLGFPVMIPAGLLAGVEEYQLAAELWLQQVASAGAPSGGMGVGVVVSVRIRWLITLLDSAASGAGPPGVRGVASWVDSSVEHAPWLN